MSKRYQIDLIVNNGQAVAATRQAQATMEAYRRAAQQAAQAVSASFRQNALAAAQATRAFQAHATAARMMAAAYTQATSQATLLSRALGGIGTAGAGAGSAITKMITAGAGIGGLVTLAGKLAQEIAQIGTNAMEAAERVIHREADVRELATMKGMPGQTDRVRADLDTFRLATKQSEAEALATQTKFYETAQASIGTKTNQAQADALLAQVGKYQGVYGGDAGAMADLVGQIVNQARGPITADQAYGQFLNIQRTFQATKGDVRSLNRQYSAMSSLYDGTLYDPERAAGVMAAFSRFSPERAGERLMQLARGTVGALGKMKKFGYQGSVSQGTYLNSLHATDQMGPEAIATLISQDFGRQEALAAQQGKKFNPYDYLHKHGYGNQQDIQALFEFHRARTSGVLGQFLATATGPAPFRETQATIAAAHATNGLYGRNLADALAAQADALRGGPAGQAYYNARAQAFQKVRGQGGAIAAMMPEQFRDWKPFGISSFLMTPLLARDVMTAWAVSGQQRNDLAALRAQVGLSTSRTPGIQAWAHGMPADQWFYAQQNDALRVGTNPTLESPLTKPIEQVVTEVQGLRKDLRDLAQRPNPQRPPFLRAPSP